MNTSKPLDGRRAVVTGAGSGIGEAIALAYAQAGAQLVLADIDAARADSVAQRCRALGAQAETVIGDVGDESTAHRIIDRCVQAFGGIDILVNNAGMLTQSRCADMSTAMWDEMLRVDLRSVFLCARRAVPHMQAQRWGRIINISSVNGAKGQAGQTNYSAAKAGMHGFTMALAQEMATKGVTVNTVSPGYIGTDMVKAIRPDVLEKIVGTIPVKRLGEPSEIASIIAWLASEEGGYSTGADFSVNGGLHMH